MLVFAVETSCDETSVSILDSSKNILSHIIYSQEEHKKFGGVIPEIASRAHLQILQKISVKALKQAKISINEIDVFCSTCGPGLIGGLLVGSIFTKALAIGTKKPFVPINHLEGHILSPTFNNDMGGVHSNSGIVNKILYLGFGSSSCMILLFLGEIANPVRLSKQMIYPYNKFTYNILSFIFSWMFIIIRCFIMTYYAFVLHNTFFSILDSTSQIILYSSCGAGLLGCYYWAYLLIKKKYMKWK